MDKVISWLFAAMSLLLFVQGEVFKGNVTFELLLSAARKLSSPLRTHGARSGQVRSAWETPPAFYRR
ncbi:hypothetical protein ILYODFUR_021612 [Ilyodon furcidens]|uniref:Kisspeptin n=1 Tax=Ilyodon furcidens TaxID=33524 RepID=A0ABV0UWY7_9TELE